MVVNGNKSKKSNLYIERFQCLLQRIVFETVIGDVVLKISVNVTILKSSSFLVAAASMIFLVSFSVDS